MRKNYKPMFESQVFWSLNVNKNLLLKKFLQYHSGKKSVSVKSIHRSDITIMGLSNPSWIKKLLRKILYLAYTAL